MLTSELRAALAATTFLTRVPLPARTLTAEDVSRAGAYFPLVGAGIGALTGVLTRCSSPAVSLVVQTLLTGALHLDALADSADGLGSGDRERALEIMRDSRIGSFGTAAMCLDVLAKSTALGGCEDPVAAAVRAGALSRAVPVVLSAALPYARPSGTAGALSSGSVARAGVAVAAAVAISRDRDAITIAAVVALASGWLWQRKLGGMTGDTLGASIEVCETAILLWSAR